MIDPATVDVPAGMFVTAEADQIRLSFRVEGGAGSVTVAMSPDQARSLCAQLIRAAEQALPKRWAG